MTHRFFNFIHCMARTNRLALLLVMVCATGFMLPMKASAASSGCYRIASANTTNAAGYDYVPPASGVAASWTGPGDTIGGSGAFKWTININVPPFVPDGTLLANGVASFTDLGYNGAGSYSPNQVLFRCTPDTNPATLKEFFVTNGDNGWAGGYDYSGTSGIPNTYRTVYNGLVSRVTNVTTGQQLTHYWNARVLTGLDRDNVDINGKAVASGTGWYLVKAKNFSQYQLELFQCSACWGAGYTNLLWADNQSFANVVFSGPGLPTSAIQVGADQTAYSATGYSDNWPGAVTGFNSISVRSSPTCAVLNATPVINFGTMTVSSLKAGGSRQIPITITMQCQTTSFSGSWSSFASGTSSQQTALGILAAPANVQSATSAGLTTTGSGITYLLSNGYGSDPSVAKGVGVALSRPGGQALNFLTNKFVTTGGTKDGWDAVTNDATASAPSGGLTTYTRTINATFKAFSPAAVTPGRYQATAQVIIRVQ